MTTWVYGLLTTNYIIRRLNSRRIVLSSNEFGVLFDFFCQSIKGFIFFNIILFKVVFRGKSVGFWISPSHGTLHIPAYLLTFRNESM